MSDVGPFPDLVEAAQIRAIAARLRRLLRTLDAVPIRGARSRSGGHTWRGPSATFADREIVDVEQRLAEIIRQVANQATVLERRADQMSPTRWPVLMSPS